jgi:hypothetical protein
MRRVAAIVLVMVMPPATAAWATDLDDLLERGQEASYSAEQIITCSTPDGVRDAVVSIQQSQGDIRLTAPFDTGVEVMSGYGGWTLSREGSVVSSAEVGDTGVEVQPRYTVDNGTPAAYLGRRATLFRLMEGGRTRAELVIDDQIGALLRAVIYSSGQVYCQRRFITFDPSPPRLEIVDTEPSEHLEAIADAPNLPEAVGDFTRLDAFADSEGLIFAYYSDGFFSFAVFETPSLVQLIEPTAVEFEGRMYQRSFSPGQVNYAWETPSGGLVLIGDLPPDMHGDVLEDLPPPARPGWFSRVWRSLFG